MALSAKQVAELEKPLDARNVATRKQSGRTLSYIEGWHAMAEANRYAAIAVDVKEICARYGQHYHTGSLPKQFGQVMWRILRHAFPSRPARTMRPTAVRPACWASCPAWWA